MIVDVLRNDLARVCEFGSVHVPELFAIEHYSSVHHLVSTIRGQLRQGMTSLDLIRAAFPGGSITGAPKVRAMQIIAELEPCAREAYCGTIGYFSPTGAMDSNIVIRTFIVRKSRVDFSAGGGIVADSDPAAEFQETLHKAQPLFHALFE
jgi:para-aminobenzoate synthetase component I